MTLVYEVDVTAHVELADDVVSAPEDHWLDVLRQHLDERLVGVFKQRHLTTKTKVTRHASSRSDI